MTTRSVHNSEAPTPVLVGAVTDERPELPRIFCWTRFGTEAGESVASILARKERERQANHGLFLWGIGNSVAPGIREILRRGVAPEVLFSPIKSRPRVADVAPQRVVHWTAGETIAGDRIELKPSVRVLSRARIEGTPAPHYALVCFSPNALVLTDHGTLEFAALRNLLSGSPLGSSQVTAIVSHNATGGAGATYPIVLRASLIAPYFLRLGGPRPVLQTG